MRLKAFLGSQSHSGHWSKAAKRSQKTDRRQRDGALRALAAQPPSKRQDGAQKREGFLIGIIYHILRIA
ncbi:hypothetical protein thsrh120_50840 [Rhizobium sp. No.120]